MQKKETIMFRGKAIGTFKGKTYVSIRNKKHFFRKYKGFGVSSSVLSALKRKGCHNIIIVYERVDGTARIFKTYPNRFFEKGHIYKDGEDYQRILPMNEFK